MILLTIILFGFVVTAWIYELQTESEEDKRKKTWLFDHGLY